MRRGRHQYNRAGIKAAIIEINTVITIDGAAIAAAHRGIVSLRVSATVQLPEIVRSNVPTGFHILLCGHVTGLRALVRSIDVPARVRRAVGPRDLARHAGFVDRADRPRRSDHPCHFRGVHRRASGARYRLSFATTAPGSAGRRRDEGPLRHTRVTVLARSRGDPSGMDLRPRRDSVCRGHRTATV